MHSTPLDELDKKLVAQTWIVYIAGKGDHLVPILFPQDTNKALKYLSDKGNRKTAGIAESNNFVFASTKSSESHCSGWHSVDNICKNFDLINRSKINATKNRHRVSTLYSALELPPEARTPFYDHMGHSGRMNHDR